MTASEAIESFEIERKYQVDRDTELPADETFEATGLQLGPLQVHHLRAEYFDTPTLALGRQRFAVRRRHGGIDAGWHLKEKGDGGARELQWTLADHMPAELEDTIRDRIGIAEFDEVAVIAVLDTERRARNVCNMAGKELAEIVDDRVHAHNVLRDVHESWREWEAELAPGGDPTVLDRIELLLQAMGARRLRGTSKIQRTMQLGS